MDVYAKLLELVRFQASDSSWPYPEPIEPLRTEAVTTRGAWTDILAHDGIHMYYVSFCGLNQHIRAVPLRAHVEHVDGTFTYYWRGRAFRIASVEDAPYAWRAKHFSLSLSVSQLLADERKSKKKP